MFQAQLVLVVASLLSSNPIASAGRPSPGTIDMSIRHSIATLDVRSTPAASPQAAVRAKTDARHISLSERIAGGIGGTLLGLVAGGYLGLKVGGGECPQPMVWGAMIGGGAGAIFGAAYFYAKAP